MALELKQGLRQSQQLVLSPQIQQAIKVLTLGRQELEEMVAEELRQNPCLEEGESQQDITESNEFSTQEKIDSKEQSEAPKEEVPDIDELLSRFRELPGEESLSRDNSESEFDSPSYDRMSSDDSNLHDTLEEQLRLMHLTEYELNCAFFLLQYLDDNGFLNASLEDLSAEQKIPADDLEYALKAIQKCEPTGVGARTLQECLLLQLRQKEVQTPLAEKILRDYWKEFEKQDVAKIARATGKSADAVKEALVYIRENLDPRPARQYGNEQQQIATPDVFIFRREDKWVVSLNEDGLPRLRISAKYENLIETVTGSKKRAGEGEGKDQAQTDKNLKEFVIDNIKNARAFVKALADRNKTILRVTEVILEKQMDFFEHGPEHLKPLTLKSVAEELGLHESTISRTTSNKYVHSPQGLFELKHFFNSGMSTDGGDELANEVVKAWVAECIRGENDKKPFSDQEIADWIQTKKSVKIARRTVAKYRESLGLLPSSKRVKKF
ncbi:MAG: RNA polymerase sigma-54 factor [Proteobacteria bacterium]|nr:RNA polymerase sigma-54 factor [Pseudomonadota bacterium]